MSDSKASKQNKSKHKHKKRKHYTVFPYINYAIIFVLVSMVIFAPVMIVGMNRAVNTVHEAQNVLVKSYNDLYIDNTNNGETGDDFINTIKVGKLIGTITCDRVGLNENIYYGINRVCLRDGVGLDRNSYLFGKGGCSNIAGYPSSSMKGLYDIKVGDVITVTSYWGTFKYEVTDSKEADDISNPEGDSLVLSTSRSTDAFSIQSSKKLFVTATLISKEVQ